MKSIADLDFSVKSLWPVLVAIVVMIATPAFGDCYASRRQARPAEEFRTESAYNVIFVRRWGDCASLSFRRRGGEWLESLSNLRDPTEIPVPYVRAMTVGLAYARQSERLLTIGLGAGTLAGYLAVSLPDSQVTAVELDPEVLRLSRNYFGLNHLELENLRLLRADGRIYLRQSRARYDVIFLDAYRGGYIPDHLATREFYLAVRAHLRPGGVVVSNLHSGTLFFDSSILTLRDVFSRVDLYRAGGNSVAVSGDALPSSRDLVLRARDRDADLLLRYNLESLLRSSYQHQLSGRARILTDNFSPANLFEAIETSNQPRP